MFWKAVCDNLGTIIGVVGSLAGGIIGWWLNNLSRGGSISIFPQNGVYSEFLNEEGFPAVSLDLAKTFNYKISLDIYNSSSDTKIMRCVEVVFFNDKKEMYTTTPYDKANKKIIDKKLPLPPVHNKVELINVPAKHAVTVHLYGWVGKENLKQVHKSTSVYLRFKDEKDKCQLRLIEKKDYSQYAFYQGEENDP